MLVLQITLDEVGFFEHRYSCTIWLGSRSQLLLDLQAALQEAFPGFDDLSLDPQQNNRGFRPHLSLGQWQQVELQASLEVREQLLQSFSLTLVLPFVKS